MEVRLVASFGGRGPSPQYEVDGVAAWVARTGITLDAAEMEIPEAGPGYRPRVVLSAAGMRTYLLVQDRVARGAPADGDYVYSWDQPMAYYLSGAVAGLLAPPEPPAAPRAIR
jgi:hypothetical protein